MKQLFRLFAITGLLVLAPFSWAGGTAPGTQIENTATVTYSPTSGGARVSASATSNALTVQELVRSTITLLDAGEVSVTTPQTLAAMKYRLTNNGNGTEGFKIITSQPTAGDEFDVTLTDIYIDNGDGILDTATDTLYDENNPPAIAPDADIVFWVTANIPSSLNDGDRAEIIVSALSKTFADDGQNNPTIGSVVTSTGDSGTDAISGENLTQVNNAFVISNINVNVTKVSSVNDGLGAGSGTQPIPGAEVSYTITVSVAGSGTAYGIEVVDPLPTSLRVKDFTASSGGIITVDGTPKTGRSGDDNVTYDQASNEITIDLGDIDAGDPDTVIEFITIIQ
ncbi:hypothetical protein [Bermanella sp. R86510]|uniref:hypothetical protein n=1 Tax=unclassified Bermanella TaxID=2627862 RepID=UPI0037C85F1B